MAGGDALNAALALLRDPASVRAARRTALPPGIPMLLELANGNDDALAAARGRTGHSREALEQAAAFFIEQVLLDRRSDSYRVLGGSSASSHAELRHNMALLMRWLHPDRHAQRNGLAMDREVFTGRVSRAWEDLKSDERRTAYDEAQARQATPGGRAARGTSGHSPGTGRRPEMAGPAPGRRKGHAGAAPARRWRFRISLWDRLLVLLRGMS